MLILPLLNFIISFEANILYENEIETRIYSMSKIDIPNKSI